MKFHRFSIIFKEYNHILPCCFRPKEDFDGRKVFVRSVCLCVVFKRYKNKTYSYLMMKAFANNNKTALVIHFYGFTCVLIQQEIPVSFFYFPFLLRSCVVLMEKNIFCFMMLDVCPNLRSTNY